MFSAVDDRVVDDHARPPARARPAPARSSSRRAGPARASGGDERTATIETRATSDGPPVEQEQRRARAGAGAQPTSSASARLSIAVSMNVAGRKIVGSTSTPARPGRSASSASSTPSRHLERVRPRELLDDEQQALGVGRRRRRRSAAGGPRRPSATSPRRRSRLGARRRGPAARPSGVAIGRMCRTCSRWLGVSMNPPLPGVDASRKLSGETSWELPVVLTICSSVTPARRSRAGSTCTWSWCSRWPQIATFATPGTPSSARPDRPARQHRQLDQGQLVRGEPDHHHPARRRERLQHRRRLGDVREACAPASAAPARAAARPADRFPARRRA